MKPGALPILTYHALDPSGSVISTTPALFASTLVSLHAEGFRSVDLDAWVAAGRPPVERGFALTFDDGLASIRLAAGMISRLGFSATAFLVTGRMGRDSETLGWNDLDDLRSAGFRFGAHSVTHRRMSTLGDEEILDEFRESSSVIEQQTGEPCRLFAYPYGDATGRVRSLARREFAAAFGTRLGLGWAGEDAYGISRIDAFYLRSPAVLARLLSGCWGAWLPLRRTARGLREAGARLPSLRPCA